jgi:hypothetical protein
MCSYMPLLTVPVPATVASLPAVIPATSDTTPTSADLSIPRIVFQPLYDSDEEVFDDKSFVEPSIPKHSVSAAYGAASMVENEASLAIVDRPNVDAHASHSSVVTEETATLPWLQPLLVSTDASDSAVHAATALMHTQTSSAAIIPPMSDGLSQPSIINVSDRALPREWATTPLPTSPLKPSVNGESPLAALTPKNETSSPIALPMLSTSRLPPMCIPLNVCIRLSSFFFLYMFILTHSTHAILFVLLF